MCAMVVSPATDCVFFLNTATIIIIQHIYSGLYHYFLYFLNDAVIADKTIAISPSALLI